ncbi:MAG: SH3 domain-containing protein [Pseudomonadota bacterium]
MIKTVALAGAAMLAAITIPAQAGIFDTIKDGIVREAKQVAVEKASDATGLNMSCASYSGSVDVMTRCMEHSVGNAISRDFGNFLRDGDLESQESSVMSTIFTGEPAMWSNSESGTSGEAKVVKEKTKTKKKKVVVLKDKVETVPELDLIGENYRAKTSTNVRGGPGTDYAVVGRLNSGDVVNVVGKVSGDEWYMISQGGVGTGYVFLELLEPAASMDATVVGAPEGDVAEVKTKTKQTCKTIEQTVTGPDGETKKDTIKACQGPNGWEIV